MAEIQIDFPEPERNAEYLGDGVYATFNGYRIKLTANVPTTDTIYLEPFVLRALNQFYERCIND